MSTLESLRPGQRSTLQLLVRHRRSYVSLAQTFQTTPERAREAAHDVVAQLVPPPATVDAGRHGQILDYVLGQLPPAEAGPVREHLAADADGCNWARDLVAALDPLYGERERPTIPASSNAPQRAGPVVRRFAPGRERSRAGPTPTRERPGAAAAAAPAAAGQPRRPGRRRTALWLIALAIVAACLAAVAALLAARDGGGAQRGGGPRLGVEHQAVMRPPGGGGGGGGIAVIASRGGQRRILVQARLETGPVRARHELWLYAGAGQSRSLGPVTVDARGNLRFAAALPADFRRFPFLDLSREPADDDPRHSGRSLLRARLPT